MLNLIRWYVVTLLLPPGFILVVEKQKQLTIDLNPSDWWENPLGFGD